MAVISRSKEKRKDTHQVVSVRLIHNRRDDERRSCLRHWRGGFLRTMAVSSILVGVLVLFFADLSSAQLYNEMDLRLQKTFTFYGSLQLTYDRRWFEGGQQGPAQTEFIKSLDLGVLGFIVDPRLVNFDVSGLLARVSRKNLGDSYTLTGVRLDLILLESLPRQWLGSWMFIPNPIMLRFSRLDDTYSIMNYGITLMHRMPEEVKLAQRGGNNGSGNGGGNNGNGNNGKGWGIPFPLTIFDYDHYDYKDNWGLKTTSNLYSLRSSITGDVYDYRFLLEKEDRSGNPNPDYNRYTAELQPNYRFFDPRTKSAWDIFNLLRYDKINDTKNYQGHSYLFYRRPMGDSGKDLLTVTGNLNLMKTSADGAATSTYDFVGRTQYDRRLSARLLLAPFAEIGYLRESEQDTGEKEPVHYEHVGTRVEADLSRIFRNTSEVFVGTGQHGLEYGVNTMFATKTRISAAAGYSISRTSLPEGSLSLQQIVLRASGPIAGNLSFDSWAFYTMQDASEHGDSLFESNFFEGAHAVPPSSENSLHASANLYWFFKNTSVSAGGSWMQSTTRDGLAEKTTTTALQASLSQVLMRQTLLTVFSSWIRDSQKNETFEVLPRLSWTKGRTSVNVDYDYRSTSTLGAPSIAEHRLFIRLVRSFSHAFRPK